MRLLTTQLAWLFLAASVVAESPGTASLNLSYGFTRLVPSASTVVCYPERGLGDVDCDEADRNRQGVRGLEPTAARR